MKFIQDFRSDKLQTNAVFLKTRINIKQIPNLQSTDSRAYMLEPETGGLILIYRYGAVVFYGMDQKSAFACLKKHIMPHLASPISEDDIATPEEISIYIDPEHQDSVTVSKITLKELTLPHLLIISDVLAKSVTLSYYEERIIEIFDLLEPVSNVLQVGDYPSQKRFKTYLKHIGSVLSIQRNIVGQVEIFDKPEVLWEQPQSMEHFYARLQDEYEIQERHQALKEKLDIVQNTAETMVDLLQTRQSLRVEWYIVFLIVFDIVLSLAEKIFHF